MERRWEGDAATARASTHGPGTPPDRVRGPDQGGARAATRVAVVAVLLTLVVLMTALAGRWDPPVSSADLDAPQAPQEFAEPFVNPLERLVEDDPFAEDAPGLPFDLRWLWGVVVVLLAGLIGWLVRSTVRRVQSRAVADDLPDEGDLAATSVGLGEGSPDLHTLRRGVEDAAGHLRDEVRPADAVVAAWVVLERAAERSGTPRDPADTPTEFTVAVLDRTEVDPAAVRTLLGLYLRARFSEEPVTREDVAEATAAVRRLAAGLAIEESEIPGTRPDTGGTTTTAREDG